MSPSREDVEEVLGRKKGFYFLMAKTKVSATTAAMTTMIRTSNSGFLRNTLNTFDVLVCGGTTISDVVV